MIDPFDETICDRSANPVAKEPRQSANAIMLIIIAGNEADFSKHFILEKEQVIPG